MNDELEAKRIELEEVSKEYAALKIKANKVKLATTRATYKRKFEEFQKRTRRKLGYPSGRVVIQAVQEEPANAA